MECANCKKRFGLFRHKHICPECGRTLCSKCLVMGPDLLYLGYEKDFRCCQRCLLKLNFDVNPKYKKALEVQDKVLTFTQNYKGKIHLNEDSVGKEITTLYFKDQREADKSLRTIAAFQGYNLVYDIKYERETRGSSYKENYFKAIGFPALQKHNHKKN